MFIFIATSKQHIIRKNNILYVFDPLWETPRKTPTYYIKKTIDQPYFFV